MIKLMIICDQKVYTGSIDVQGMYVLDCNLLLAEKLCMDTNFSTA
jgi:hypothetical protein